MSEDTINSMLQASIAQYGSKDVLQYKEDDTYVGITYGELGEKVKNFSLGLVNLGIEKGDRVAMLSENRYQWAITDLAILAIGAITVPIFPTLIPLQMKHIIADSEASSIIVSTSKQLKKVLEVKDSLPELESLIIMDEVAPEEIDTGVLSFQKVAGKGAEMENGDEIYQQLLSSVKPDDLATIIYTSGTTGKPKGAMLTHYNFMSNATSCIEILNIDSDDVFLSVLPLSHVFERLAGYYVPLTAGSTIAYAESPSTLAQNFQEIRPTVMACVPRVYELMHAKIIRKVESGSAIKRKIFYWGVKVGEKVSRKLQKGEKVSGMLAVKAKIADLLVFNKLKQVTGGRLRFFVSGGAPLPRMLAEFFHAAGILILEGYGLTETSPVIGVNRPENYKFGTIGPTIPGVEVKIADDGEILSRGPHIMKGYYNMPEETKRAIDEKGWFHTGDIGYLDEDGFLSITDRKKNIIVLSSGKNVAPQPIENQLKRSPYVNQILLIGDKCKVISALIVPDFEQLEEYARYQNISYQDLSDLVTTDKIKRMFRHEIDRLSEGFADFERVRMFTLRHKEFSIEADEVTPTLKLKRRKIIEKHKELIERMYLRPKLKEIGR